MLRTSVWLSCCLVVGACSEAPVAALDDSHGAPPEGRFGAAYGATTCAPYLQRYPVAGPHNGGYDQNALNYTCPPHPGGSPDNSDFSSNGHFGNDLFAAKGTPAVAPRTGTIVNAGNNPVGGLRVTVKDSCGWSYYMAHLDSIDPSIYVGKAVNAGDPVGRVGNTGNASGTSPHIHFSIYPDGCYNCGIDPFPHLQAVDASACTGSTCNPHCEGTKIIAADCGVGDCGAFGATCIISGGAPKCAASGCTPHCSGTKIVAADCSEGDCGAFGLPCGMVNGKPQCVASCAPKCEGTVMVAADCSKGDCGAFGAKCTMDGGAPKCVLGCTPNCQGTVMVAADCSQGDCGAFGAACVMSGGKPTCQAPTCEKKCSGSTLTNTNCSKTNCADQGKSCIQGAGGPACGGACTAHCEGTVAYGADCGHGDCGAFGANCAMVNGQATCKTPCDPHCEGTVVVDAQCGRGDCAAFGSTCELDGNLAPKCKLGCTPHCEGNQTVDANCEKGNCAAFGVPCGLYGDGPKCGAQEACQEHCDGDQIVYSDCTKGNCGAFGMTCGSFNNGPQCTKKSCTPHCEGNKAIGSSCNAGDCGVFGAYCQMSGGEPRCVFAACVDTPSSAPYEHNICFQGKRFHCDSAGGVVDIACPAGQACNSCAGCGPDPVEVCDYKDNDCDGQIDEGVLNACSGCGATPTEICDYADNDCDGQVDEDLRNACNQCGALPVEICNYVDDNCDGQIDEGTRNACGLCGPVAVEVCNYADDDCDGATDQGFLGLGDGCTVGKGACAAPGLVQCRVDGTDITCVGTEGTPGLEVCNSADDDCNGTVDDGFGVGDVCTVGTGMCGVPGSLVCDPDGTASCSAPALDCNDGDGCTKDGCDPGTGCTHTIVASCCGGPAGCPGGTVCDDGVCVGVLCAKCSEDSDCSVVGAACLTYPEGKRCGVPCAEGDSCPVGFECAPPHLETEGVAQCVGASGSCTCGFGIGKSCFAGAVAQVDSCGSQVELIESCPNGCSGGICCGAGSEEEDGLCVPTGGGDVGPIDAGPTPTDVAGPDDASSADLGGSDSGAPDTSDLPGDASLPPADIAASPDATADVPGAGDGGEDTSGTPKPDVGSDTPDVAGGKDTGLGAGVLGNPISDDGCNVPSGRRPGTTLGLGLLLGLLGWAIRRAR